jgi:leucyl aminopeptidase
MELKLIAQDLTQTSKTTCDALIVLVPESFAQSKAKTTGNLTDVISQALKDGDFETKTGKLLQIYRSNHTSATRTVLVGAGDGSVKSVKTAVTAAVASIKSTSSKKVVICLSELSKISAESVKAAVLCAADASYVYTSTKTKVEPRKLTSITVAVDKDALNATDLIAVQAYITPAMSGIEFAKEWGNRPANHATPDLLGKAAKSLAKYKNISVDVLGLKEVTKLGMGSFISVAQGSDQPLRFIVLKYNGAAKSVAPTVLVGKGITFDTGGISLKPAPEMDEMKFDMCGAASVLGTFRALAGIQPKINVVGLIPACENMPSGKAVKPGDVVTSMSGQTIENLNTDAEGRLVLCDALQTRRRHRHRHLDRCLRHRLGRGAQRFVQRQRRLSQRLAQSRRIQRRPVLAHAFGRRIWRRPQIQLCRHGQRRRSRGWLSHRRQVFAEIHRQLPMGAFGYCGHGVEEWGGQRLHGSSCALVIELFAEFRAKYCSSRRITCLNSY